MIKNSRTFLLRISVTLSSPGLDLSTQCYYPAFPPHSTRSVVVDGTCPGHRCSQLSQLHPSQHLEGSPQQHTPHQTL